MYVKLNNGPSDSMCLLSSTAFQHRSFLKEHVWFLSRPLKVLSQRPMYMYVSFNSRVATSAW